jgi:dTDP-4-dehydrorhamnose reductase
MIKNKRIYIAGSGGMLGEAFYNVYRTSNTLRCTDKDVNEKWLDFLDFRDAKEYRNDVEAFRPDYLFHLGALTSLEYCEDHSDEAYATNTTAVENAVHIANALNIPLLYISTAGIFDGKKQSYDDWDDPAPLGHYARSKLLGERFVSQNIQRHLVCRAGWMMGAGPLKDKKFIQKLMKQIKDGKSELYVVDDKFGTPTYTIDFARNVGLLLEHQYWGVYNMVCGGVTERLEVAKELIRIIGREEDVKIIPVSSEYFAKEYFANRPKSEQLITKKLQIRQCNIMREWRICLREYLDTYYSDYLD